ncbi:MAG: hypothetical protein RML46_09910 [Anaerolineae bacterium]|nr:hypothetical protein [Anaerolineae bacterium]MDW8069218.1 hypothetical protein [Anaerolineae bacterium]
MLNKLLNLYNTRKTTLVFITGIIIGLATGLLFAWIIWPTSYYNATPAMLRQDFRDDYLVWVAREYAQNRDIQQAQTRLGLAYWKKEPIAVLEDLAQRRGGTDGENLRILAQALKEAPPPPPAGPGFGQRVRTLLQICGMGLLVTVLAGLLYYGVSRLRRPKVTRPSERAAAYRQVTPTRWEEAPPPHLQFSTTYILGDDHYDPSFSIERGAEFLGECGVGISEAIGVGDPKKVTALEVWMFDKSDIRTVTKVLASGFAYQDPALRAKLAAKGEIVLATPGAEVLLETTALFLRARVVDMEYGTGQLPPESFFQRISLELGVWFKETGEKGIELPFDEEFVSPPTL